MHFSSRSKLGILLSLLIISSIWLTQIVSNAITAHAAGPHISLALKVGPPTSSVQVTGMSFGVSELIILDFDSTQIGTSTTDSTGTFIAKITIPSSALPGAHTIQASGQTSGLSSKATFLVQTNWPMVGFNSHGIRFNPFDNSLAPTNVSGLSLDWSKPTAGGGPSHSSPVVYNGVVYVGAGVSLYAMSASTGTSLWSYTTGGITVSSPAVANGVVYIGSSDNNLYALNAKTGVLLWSYTTKNSIYSSPTVANGVVYVGSYDNNLYALNAKTGALLWTASAGDSIYYSSPAVSSGLVFIASGYLNAVG
jgi:outer membrane protein assembly factor BamB